MNQLKKIANSSIVREMGRAAALALTEEVTKRLSK